MTRIHSEQIESPLSFGNGYGILYIGNDGTLVLSGTATVYRDEMYSLVGQRLESPSSHLEYDESEGAVFYDTTSDLTDYVTMSVQLNHDWKGTVIKPHLHWWQNTTGTPNWLLQYRYHKNGENKTADWTSIAFTSNIFTFTTGTLNQITSFGDLTPPVTPGLSDILQLRLLRDVANTSTLFAAGADTIAADQYAVSLDVHIEIDSFGSSQEYVK